MIPHVGKLPILKTNCQKYFKKSLPAGGKPSTMVTAGKTYKAGHFEEEMIEAQFALMKFLYFSVFASDLFFEKNIFSPSDLFRRNQKNDLFNFSIAMTSRSTETPFRLQIVSHM